MKKLIALAAAMILSVLAVVGCGSSSAELDREVTIGPLSYRVSSQWTEESGSDEGSEGRWYDLDGGGHVEVWCFDFSGRSSSPDTFEEYASWHEEDLGETLSVTSTSVIDGAEATRYTYSSNYGGQDTQFYCLHMVRGDIEVGVSGTDEAIVDDVINSIHLEG